VTPFFRNWQALTVARTASVAGERESTFGLVPTLDASSRTAVYAAALPPGDYRFVQFSSQACGAICMNAFLNVDREFSHFRIESGRLTDLGVIVQSASPGHPDETMMAHDNAADHPETPELVRELFPDLGGLTLDTPLSWRPESVPADMTTLRAYTLSHSAGLAAPRALVGGGFIYGTANGMLISVTPGRPPVANDVGVRSSIEAVLVSGDGNWFVGGELGLLRFSRNHGRTWESIRGNIPFGTVLELGKWDDQIIATTIRGKDVYIHAAKAGTAEWRQLARYAGAQGVRTESFVVGDALITTLPQDGKVAYFDLRTGQSEVRSSPGIISLFSVSADGALHCICGNVIQNPYESHDLGKTWTGSSVSRFMTLPAFRDEKHGVAFKGSVFSHATLVYTGDGGRTWTDAMDAPAGARKLFYSNDGSVAYVGTAYGAFWASRDDGKTWESLVQ
jgi:photosystem II stability/assembly factor-like uncharacterized protein